MYQITHIWTKEVKTFKSRSSLDKYFKQWIKENPNEFFVNSFQIKKIK